MDLTEFTDGLRHLSVDDIHRVPLRRWRVTPSATRSTPGTRPSPSTAPSVTPTSPGKPDAPRGTPRQTVQRTAEDQQMELPDVDVTHVAVAAAAEIARGLVAGDDVAAEVQQLLQHWFPVIVRL